MQQAVAAAEQHPDRVSVNKAGWVTMKFPNDHTPDAEQLQSWVVESYRVLVPKRVSRQLPI